MAFEEINSLNKLDDKFIKNFYENRSTFIDSGEETLKVTYSKIKKVVNKLHLNKENVYIKDKEILDSSTIITLATNESSLAPYYPGQYVIVSAYIAGNYYSRPYYILSSKKNIENGEYIINVLKNDDSIMANFLRNIKINETVYISGPYGNFYYSSVRDCNNIIAICEDYGINAAYSLAKRIIEESLDITLNILYNVKKYKDILFLEELTTLAKNPKIKLEIITSEEIVEGYDSGYVTLDIVKKYLAKENSIFIYAKEGMLKYLNRELEPLKLPRRYIRYEDFLPRCNVKNVKKFDLLIKYKGKDIKHSCYNNRTLLDSIEDSRVVIESISRTGKDNLCLVKVISGKLKIVNDERNATEELLNLVDPSNTYPCSDTKIEIL